MIDLHLHSDVSDGALSPAALVRRAAADGLRAIALTDHDSLDGVCEAMEEGDRRGVEVISGVEISVSHEPGTFHLIGLFVRPEDGRLAALLDEIRESRARRNREVVRRLAEQGVPIRIEEVVARSGRGVVGRPHLAGVLIEKGFVRTRGEAFRRYLGKGCPAYVERFKPDIAGAIEAVRGAGGVTVLCHPFTLGLDAGDLSTTCCPFGEFVKGLAERGLDAVEIHYGDHSPAQRRFCEALAEDAGLLASGGSDFHGLTPKTLRNGFARGIPYEVLEALRDRAEARRRD